ncbi:MAG: TraB/GumN family protein [Treponema sp.]|uniref:TraB/GumN family protein n=1 Tax=Treponema sp. TaxID=166 RepID=UPI00298E2153|nr:TraB/GumN family protein [Treponema sp.]MBR5933772.1 TraB/GumN family protein [Treponema sp.]
MSSTKKVLNLDGRKITLIGTAHVSKESIQQVTEEIINEKPDCVAVELDERRYNSMTDTESWKKLDIIKVLKRHEGFLMLVNLVLSSFQKRMGQNVGVKPGDELLAAIKTAQENGIPFTLVDRPVQTTLRRAWAKNSFFGKCKLLASLLFSAFDKEEVSEEQIENLKKENEMGSMMNELAEYLPAVKEVLIDERDRYLATHIWNSSGNNVVAVLGAGHLNGVEAYIQKIADAKAVTDTSDIESIPDASLSGKIIGWAIPVIIVGLVVAGFFFGGKKVGSDMVLTWVLWNGILSAVGTVLSLGHPVTILVAFAGAPLTSLCPFIGVGFLTGITQAVVCKPKVSDMETLQDDASSLKGWYKNRIIRVLMVFVLSSLGSTIGTFAAGADIVSLLSNLGLR